MAQFVRLLLFTIIIVSSAQALPPPCEQAKWKIAGADLVARNRGHIVVVAFMPARCNICEAQFQRLMQLSRSEREVKTMIVVPSSEPFVSSNEYFDVVRNVRTRYVDLSIWIDSRNNSAWNSVQAAEHDHFIYDRCGRLAEVIRSPGSDMSRSMETQEAVSRAKNFARCGWCEYDPQPQQLPDQPRQTSAPRQPKPDGTDSTRRYPSQMVTVRGTMAPRENPRLQQQRVVPQPAHPGPPKEPERTRPWNENQVFSSKAAQRPNQQLQASYQRPIPEDNVAPNKAENEYRPSRDWDQRPDMRSRDRYPQSQRPYPAYQPEPIAGDDRRRQGHLPDTQQARQQQFDSRQPEPFKAGDQLPQTTASPTYTKKDYDDGDVQRSLYGGSEERGYGGKSDSRGRTLAPMQTQISAPVNHQMPVTTPYHSSDGLFCDHVTDERCFREKNAQAGSSSWWKKCCSKGIYLTDICVSGRCTNSTSQICCAQKFLQARYRCCNNETQRADHATDAFSRCCHQYFVDPQDPCCPLSAAKSYWTSTAELCLPSVSVNFTGVQLEGKIGTQKVVVNFGEDRSWQYICNYGTNVMQFVYLPDSDEV